MADESISTGAKLAIGAGVLFMVSAFKSCEDLRFRMSGKTTTAPIASIVEQHNKGQLTGYDIIYNFRNENSGKNVKGRTFVNPAEVSNYSVGQTVDIEYIGDEMFSSRIVGTSGPGWTIFFLVSLVATIVGLAWLTIQSNREQSKPTPRRKSAGK